MAKDRFPLVARSALDLDYYTLPMQQYIFYNHSDVSVRYRLIDRKQTEFPPGFADILADQFQQMGSLRVEPYQIAHLRAKYPYLKHGYLDFLSEFRPDPSRVRVWEENGRPEVEVEDLWFRGIWYEQPSMYTTSELLYKVAGIHSPSWALDEVEAMGRFFEEHNMSLTDFGVRRRESAEFQSQALDRLERFKTYKGTSSVHDGIIKNHRLIGTMAHQLVMVLGALYGYQGANLLMMQGWMKEFGARLGTVLPDALTTEVFLRDFSYYFASAFDSVRWDSGLAEVFTDRFVDHFQGLGIDPATKTFIYSDGLNEQKAWAIDQYAESRGVEKRSYGVGQALMNHTGHPLWIVMKPVAATRPGWPWIPVVKLPDDPGKVTGDPEVASAVAKLLQVNW
ncbi:hypothetical protein A2382_01345 [Candidatus Woesebacteria bacterium RIFOXYB1_FULL_38_16]|uniref:nicotinate phosphoribosyltransferase n=1 Tax=Candidatus Woesebacteria bacterium RIFOXYB1_FULL_38_16 TaxID=1802538 RepID=A0A1F8CRT3_9BACT|nr:MAG: hypothetical protein A2191_03360 [Candidatus Woesebacteria bacterium RIFOXYA1_FULL_38_9]OGM79043.1 MAG: hypothetical protein A2382_01345 [Candidatus Woesebacteria bacterium RIFOXYB1_FULL_38_16]